MPVPEVPAAQAFRFRSGAEARTLAQLADAIARETPADVAYHREHFSPWLRDVLRDEGLARRFEHFARMGGDPDVLRDTLAALARQRARGAF